MRVRRDLRAIQRDPLSAHLLTETVRGQVVALTHSDRHTPLQVGKRKSHLAIAAVRRADQLKQGGVLTNGKQSPVAWQPTVRREGECEALDLPDERHVHPAPLAPQ